MIPLVIPSVVPIISLNPRKNTLIKITLEFKLCNNDSSKSDVFRLTNHRKRQNIKELSADKIRK